MINNDDNINSNDIKNNVCDELFQCSLLRNSGNKHQNNIRLSAAETLRHESTYLILFLTQDIESINDDKIDDL